MEPTQDEIKVFDQRTDLPPHSIEAEEAVLGSVLIDQDCFLDVVNRVKAEDFFLSRHRDVFEAMCAIAERNEDIDNLTVIQEMVERETLSDAGGPGYITQLINNTPSHTHALSYASLIAKAAVRRRMLTALGEAAMIAYRDNATLNDIVDKVWTILDDAAEHRGGAGLQTFYEAGDEALDEWLTWTANPADIRGFRTGIKPLDYMVGGFLPERVCSLIMPTSGGKSTVTRQILISLIEQGPGLLCPTEMSGKAMMHGLVSQALNLDSLSLQRGMSGDAIGQKYAELMGKNGFMLNAARPTIANIETMARKLRRRFGTRPLWMIVDSGSNVDVPTAKNIFDKTSKVSNTLAQIAVDYNFWIFVTWQMNRQSYGNTGAGINAGRGGGDIENDSDYVFTIDREEYKYKAGLSTPPAGWQPQSDGKEKCTVRCLKSRHNPIAGRAFDAWFTPGRGIVPMDNRT